MKKRKFITAVMIPSLLVGIAAFVFDGSDPYPPIEQNIVVSSIPRNQLEFSSVTLNHRFGIDRIQGTLKNNSPETLLSLTLRITKINAQGETQTIDITLSPLSIPSGESGSFHQTFGDLYPGFTKNFTWSFQVLSAFGK